MTAATEASPAAARPLAAPHRLHAARAVFAAQGLNVLLVTQRDNIGWLSGFTGSNAFILLTPERALFATDSRYTTQAERECPGFELVKLATSAPDEIIGLLTGLSAARIGFEAGHLTFQQHETYAEKMPPGTAFLPTVRLIEDLRMVKDAEEIARIEAACALTDRAWEHILPFLKPGAVERDIMLELEGFLRGEGGAEIAFDTIVASGPRSALPHGRAADRILQKGDFVTLDFGANLNQYCSDITRTVVLGTPTDEQRKVYRTVLEALHLAIAAMKPGVSGKAVDALAREHIAKAGYGDYFGHGLGHSLGRAVHDGPGLSPRSDVTLAAGMVITVEPGIYIPNWGGCRIEHDVLVTDDGTRVLTHAPTDLDRLSLHG